MRDLTEPERRVLASTVELGRLFGVPSLAHVNRVLVHIALDTSPDYPAWLTGKKRLAELPRYVGEPLRHSVAPARPISSTEAAAHVHWIIENLNEGWHLAVSGFSFATELDAMYYQIRFASGISRAAV